MNDHTRSPRRVRLLTAVLACAACGLGGWFMGRSSSAADTPYQRLERSAVPAGQTGVVVTPGGAKYHRPGCRHAKGGDRVSVEDARKAGYEPCKVCRP